MRKIIGNIKSVFNIDYKNKIIVFILCNKYNQPIIKPINPAKNVRIIASIIICETIFNAESWKI